MTAVAAQAAQTPEAGAVSEPSPEPSSHRLGFVRRASTHDAVPAPRRATASKQRVMGLTVVDQAASSLSNFALAFLVAHYSHAHQLGVFAIISTTYILTQGLVRSLTSDCLLTRHDAEDTVMGRFERGGFLSALACSIAAGALMLVVSLAFSGDLRLVFVILGLTFPLLACQDYARYIGISRFNPAYAVWLDMVWLVLFLGSYVPLRHNGFTSLSWVFGAWAVTGAVVGLYALWNHLARREQRHLVAFWFKSEKAVGLRFAGQWMLVSSWAYVAIYLFVLIFSLAVIGQFKLAQLAFGPMTVIAQGIVTAMVAIAARSFQVDVRRALRFVFLGGFVTSAFMMIWCALLYYAPVHGMTTALGPTWPAARAMVPLMGLVFVGTSMSGAASAGLRSIRAAKENLRLAVAMVPVLFVTTMTSGILWGVKAAIAGLAVGYAIYSVAGWVILVRSSHRVAPGAVTAETDDQASSAPASIPAPA